MPVDSVHAITCSFQIDNVSYPTNVLPSQQFRIETRVSATCSHASVYIVGRADLTDAKSGTLLSSSSLGIGYFQGGETKTASNSNPVTAPSSALVWDLIMSVTLYAPLASGQGGESFGTTSQRFSVQVGQRTTTVAVSSTLESTTGGPTLTATTATATIATTSTITETQTAGFVITSEQVYLGLAIVFALAFGLVSAAFLMARKHKPN